LEKLRGLIIRLSNPKAINHTITLEVQ
jgi:threonine/homoserine/homoserine lactone efflux protein